MTDLVTVLYVDDDEGNLTIFESSFLREYDILTADSGKAALSIIETQKNKKQPIQILLTDQRMPEMTGIELLKIVQEKYPDIICIIVTAYSDIGVVVAALNECNIYRYINKPWDKNELLLTLNNAAETYKLRKQNQLLIDELQDANLELALKVNELEQLNKKITSYTLNIVQKNERIEQVKTELQVFVLHYEENFKLIKDIIQSLQHTLKLDKDWQDFMISFEKVHVSFFSTLKERFPDLSSGYLKICTFIKLNLSTKEIASIMGISPQSVNVARYRLRKKLNLAGEDSLDDYLRSI